MENKKRILIIGGDERQQYLCSQIKKTNPLTQHIYRDSDKTDLSEKISTADVIILPLPITKNSKNVFSKDNSLNLSLTELQKNISETSTVLGGMFESAFKSYLKEKNISFFDFYLDSGLITENSYLTALGTLRLVLENTKESITSKKFLVTGFGALSKAVTHYLKAMDADVYVAARNKAQQTQAKCLGCNALNITDIEKTAHIYDFIINTVPSQIFENSCISKFKKESVYIELASKPFGAKKEDFENKNITYVFAPSLPGRFFPKSSAKAIYNSIYKYL